MEDKENGSSFKRRDELLEIQYEVRKWWDEFRVFEVEANDEPAKYGEKFFGTFPFPYMNGHLHIGHAFTISKVEFAAAYHRLRGANVLLPFGFHCTGTPIKASAGKIEREMEQFGNPPCFPSIESDSKPELADDGNTSEKKYK
jgi:leucyl-tRNA synthetase